MTQIRSCIRTAAFLALAAGAVAQTPVFTNLGSVRLHPYWGLVQGLNGQLYSETAGTRNIAGQIFEITTGGSVTYLHKLHGNAQFGLLLATDGNFYGTTPKGQGAGKIFRVTHSSKLSIVHAFCSLPDCADGDYPWGSLIQGSDGYLYGTTVNGGPGCTEQYLGCGTIFRMTLAGELTTLYTFCLQAGCPDGRGPSGAIVQTPDGSLYGVAGSNGGAEIWRLTPAGTLTVLYTFCERPDCRGGSDPQGGLSLGPDGALYGATVSYATIFKITPDGRFQVLVKPGGPAYAPPIPATDGNLYGTVEGGGTHGYGYIYKMTPSGDLTILYSFCALPECADGYSPQGPVLQATDGNFYGTTFRL